MPFFRTLKNYAVGAVAVAGAVYLLGGFEGVKDRTGEARRWISTKTGRPPVEMTTHDKDFRFKEYLTDDRNDPKDLRLVVEYVGNPFETPTDKGGTVIHVIDPDPTKKKAVMDYIDAAPSRNHVWVKLKPPSPKNVYAGSRAYEDTYNGGRQWFVTDKELLEFRSFGQKKADPTRSNTRPLP